MSNIYKSAESGPTPAINTIAGDIGTATGTTITIFANNAANNAGSSVKFVASGSQDQLNVTDSHQNTLIGTNTGNLTLTGSDNTAVGFQSLSTLTSGSYNTALGFESLSVATTGNNNTSIGQDTLRLLTTASDNTAIGMQALYNCNGNFNCAIGNAAGNALTSGTYNTFLGFESGIFLTTGTANLLVGAEAGLTYTTSESSNICLANQGVIADANTIRIGTSGSGSGQQNKCYIAGIDGVNVGSVAKVVTETGDQLGTATITAGTGISVTPGANTITIAATGSEMTWTAISASQTLAVGNGYFCTGGAALSLALPAVSAVGDTIEVTLDGSTSWTITQPNAATRIRIAGSQTTLGATGTLASSSVGDTVRLICQTANARWQVTSFIGNLTPA